MVQRKLKGQQTYFGYTHSDYKEWGQNGGRPRKFKNEAEKKRFYRQQKALAEGRTLRGYRSFSQRVKTGSLNWYGKDKLYRGGDLRKCPNCGVIFFKKNIGTRTTEWGGEQDYCIKCGFFPKKTKTIWRAGTGAELKSRQRKKKKESEEEDEDEED